MKNAIGLVLFFLIMVIIFYLQAADTVAMMAAENGASQPSAKVHSTGTEELARADPR